MRYLVTSAEMKRYDQNCIERIGIPSVVLMERAALETFYALREKAWIQAGEKALILSGVGNNGGDGLALARLLSEAGMKVFVYVAGNEEKATVQWKEQREILKSYPVVTLQGLDAIEDAYTVIIDAIFGVGLSREVEGAYKEAISRANELHGHKVSLDVPSGVSSDDGRIFGIAFQAELTVTYGFEKRGLYLYPGVSAAGEIRLADVGISSSSFFEEKPDCFVLEEGLEELLPKRRPDGNKGTFGKALILAGSKNMAGAAILCGNACYRLGAGMVKVMTSSDNRVILQETLPEALFGCIEDAKELEKSLEWCDVICVGPGLGKDDQVKNAFDRILEDPNGIHKPLVIDADGINLLSEDARLRSKVKSQGESGRTIVLTPHPGELLKLVKSLQANEKKNEFLHMEQLKSRFFEYAMMASRELSAIVVAKDARSLICFEGRPICMNLSGNNGMGTAGSGDVLAGILTAFLCQDHEDAFMTICRGVRTHGLLGDELAKADSLGSHGVMASKFCEVIKNR